jgi:hypothetical protein
VDSADIDIGESMRHAKEAAAANPFDVRALWKIKGTPLDQADTAYRAWLDGATRMQTEAAAFWNDRLGKDVEALGALSKCTNPGEAFEIEMRYARDAMADYVTEGQRMMRMMTDVTRQFGLPATGEAQAASKAE